MTIKVSKLQRKILNIIQSRFPVAERPFAVVAKQLGTTEAEVMKQVERLKNDGVIRRIGAFWEAGRLGYCSTLVAARARADELGKFVEHVNALEGVSHNYGRRGKWNVWFTLAGPSEKEIAQTLGLLKERFARIELMNLPALKRYKISVEFDLECADGRLQDRATQQRDSTMGINAAVEKKQGQAHNCEWSVLQKRLLVILQEDMAITAEPFGRMADAVGAEVKDVLGQIEAWKDEGFIRRFGASVRQNKAGLGANALVVFEVDADKADAMGRSLAGSAYVSHCYRRTTAAGWPYNLYAMMHGADEEQLRAMVEETARQIQAVGCEALFTEAEYKKSNVRYKVESERAKN